MEPAKRSISLVETGPQSLNRVPPRNIKQSLEPGYQNNIICTLSKNTNSTPRSTQSTNLMATSSWQTQRHLEAVINQPLECSQRSNHHNSNGQSIPQSHESNIAINPHHCLARTLSCLPVGVEFANHHVRGMRDRGTGNTCDVSS